MHALAATPSSSEADASFFSSTAELLASATSRHVGIAALVVFVAAAFGLLNALITELGIAAELLLAERSRRA